MSHCICIDTSSDESYNDCTQSWEISDGTVQCCECHAVIPAGNRYLEEHCYMDDLDSDDCPEDPEFDVYKTCPTCYRSRFDYFKCDWTYGSMWEDLDNNLESDDDCYKHRIKP